MVLLNLGHSLSVEADSSTQPSVSRRTQWEKGSRKRAGTGARFDDYNPEHNIKEKSNQTNCSDGFGLAAKRLMCIKSKHTKWRNQMNKNLFIKVDEMVSELQISKPYAYKLMREMNEELQKRGFMTIAGRVSRQFFEEKFYGFRQEAVKNVSI